MSSSPGRFLRASGDRRSTEFRRALVVGLVLSAAFHLVLLVLPPVETGVPAHLAAPDTLVVLPPIEDQPPEVQVPPSPEPIPQPSQPVVAAVPTPAGDDEPGFVPHDVPPRLINPHEVRRYLELFYPVALRAAEVEGAVHLWLFVNERGETTKLQVRSSSGAPQFDELAKSAAPFMRFRPAMNRGESIGVWVSIWVRFDIEDLPPDPSQLAEAPAR